MFGLKRLHRIPDVGRAYESRTGWLVIQWGGEIYSFSMDIGRLSIAIESRDEQRQMELVRKYAKEMVHDDQSA